MAASTISGLYAGRVMHQRVKPRRHRLEYSMFSLLLDLDEIDALDGKLSLFSRNRFNLFSFFDRDYGANSDKPIRLQIEGHLAEAGLQPDGGPIRVLTMPRILGYAFNPLSVFFCYRRDETLSAIFYEVSNTFGERHSYLLPVENPGAAVIRQKCPKQFYVSPFMDMTMDYAFRVVPPAERVMVAITGSDAEGPIITAALSSRRRELTDGALAKVFFTFPLLTLKVMAGIHFEAFFIWIKGVGFRKRPSPPSLPVTTVSRTLNENTDGKGSMTA
jgi:DUF1365 family protein